MNNFYIDESKYSLESRLTEVNASSNVRHLLESFIDGITQITARLNLPLFAKTQIRGITYYVTERKAFIFIDFHRDFLTLKFYTGRSSIDGLQKINWNAGGDNTGSESFRVRDAVTLKKAIQFAEQSALITHRQFPD